MEYEDALVAAGARIHDFRSFGSYQGDWIAKITHEGVTGYVRGSFGSCTGCDAFEAEFGYTDREYCAKDHWEHTPTCADCVEAKIKYEAKLKLFGQSYLDVKYTHEELVYEFADQMSWDYEAREVIDWLAEH